MRRPNVGIAILVASCLLVGCGYKTHPRPATESIPGDVGLVEAQVVPSKVVLKWDVPKLNSDGSSLKDLSGFKVFRTSHEIGEACEDCDTAGVFHANVDLQNPANAEIVDGRVVYSDPKISPGNVYYYSVAAYNLRGIEGPRTSAVTVTFDELPPSPEGLGAIHDSGGIVLRWDAPLRPAGIRAYRIYRSESPDPMKMKLIGRTRWAENRYVDSDVDRDTPYYYVVRSMKMNRGIAIESAPSVVIQASYPRAKAETPTKPGVAPAGDGIRVGWEPVKIPNQEVRYNVYRSEGNKPAVRINDGPLSSILMTDRRGLRKGRRYYYSVTAFPAGRPEDESPRSASADIEYER